jgi:hypothetical protein
MSRWVRSTLGGDYNAKGPCNMEGLSDISNVSDSTNMIFSDQLTHISEIVQLTA